MVLAHFSGYRWVRWRPTAIVRVAVETLAVNVMSGHARENTGMAADHLA
jgi:hypothetical protein